MRRKAVAIIDDSETIRVLADPTRRGILRLLANQPMTETQLSEALFLSKASVSYHLRLLRKAKLIKVERTEVEEHGIVQKYYSPIALVFIVDYAKAPPETRRFFLDIHLERLRGIMGLFRLFEGHSIVLPSEQLERLAEDSANYLSRAANKYEALMTDENRESIVATIYAEALRAMMESDRWRPFFERFQKLTGLIQRLPRPQL